MTILDVEFSFGTGAAFQDDEIPLSDGVADVIELESSQWMNNRYEPIACSLHDEYEIAIMHKKYLDIKWSGDGGEEYTDTVLPKDILVKDKAEFLVVNTRGNKEMCIRLDKITLL